jgi:hypothetical protein
MTPRRAGPARVRTAHVEALMQSLSERDWTIIESTNQLRLVTGKQLERLHFSQHSFRSRSVMRWRMGLPPGWRTR